MNIEEKLSTIDKVISTVRQICKWFNDGKVAFEDDRFNIDRLTFNFATYIKVLPDENGDIKWQLKDDIASAIFDDIEEQLQPESVVEEIAKIQYELAKKDEERLNRKFN